MKMKFTLLFLVIFIMTRTISNGQILDSAILQCQYKYSHVKDTLNLSKISNDFMILNIGKKVSEFYSYNTFRADSAIAADIEKGTPALELLVNRAKYGKKGALYHIYKNYPETRITVTYKLPNNRFKYNESLNGQEWVIAKEKAVILGYTVQKATCSFSGREYTAWFTPDIPINAGPWKFGGLPGLILSVEDSQKYFKFEIEGIKNLKTFIPISIEKGDYVNTTKKESLKLEAKMSKDFLAFSRDVLGIDAKPVGNRPPPTNKPYNPIER